MQHLEHQTRPFPVRTAQSQKLQWALNATLVAAAFAFVGAVTLGLFP